MMLTQPTGITNLEYQHVHDLCAMQAAARAAAPESVAVVASSRFHAEQLLTRLPEESAAVLYGAREWLPYAGWYTPWHDESALGDQRHGAIIWAEPSAETAHTQIRAIAAALPPGGGLSVIVSQHMARRLTEWRERLPLPEGSPLGWRATETLLRAAGFRSIGAAAFRGPVSLTAGLISGVLEGRGALVFADRWQYRMRAAFAAARWERPLATLGVIHAERPS
ncbi:MAG: hypothetical protein GYB67_00115 [Chloroflexi bacterium]|nr:hypothetical protein [Chloroflexota bacterium]